MRRLSIAPIACAMIAIPVAGRATPAAEIVRTVYVSAHDVSGAQVTDLTVADLAVKEGGKNRVIKDVTRASEPLQVSLLVFDGGTGGFQTAAARFIDALLPRAEFAIRVFNPQPSRIADFTNDIETLKPRSTASVPAAECRQPATRSLKPSRMPPRSSGTARRRAR